MAQWIHSVLTKNSWVSHHGVVGAAALPGTGPIGSALVTSAPRRAAMDQYVALDVSLKEVSVCVLGADGTLIGAVAKFWRLPLVEPERGMGASETGGGPARERPC